MTSKNDERRTMEKSFEHISPFELKNKLIHLATGKKRITRTMLDAGRGNPNWIAATPREAYFAFGQFAVSESRRTWNEHDLAGMPHRQGIYSRFQEYVKANAQVPGIQLLKEIIDYGVEVKNYTPDEWLFELVDGIIGDNYPMPDRMLVRVEQVVHDFLDQELYSGHDAPFDLFAVEGATAAMCYIFDTLIENYLLAHGSKIAIMVPIFPPYVEIPHLARYSFELVEIYASAVDEEGRHTWQYPKSELDKLKDPSIKALFLVNPSNPPSVAIDQNAIHHLIQIVKEDNPDLMIISDDVYGTFVQDFRSLMVDLPYNTVGVYSFSKYFGVTGWRLGTIAVSRTNVFDKIISELPDDKKQILHDRYSSLTQHPEELRFIDRLVADSRTVALNHTAGLSTPQQVQMAFFSIFALLDKTNRYKQQTVEICQRRMKLLYDGLGIPEPTLANAADYYTQFDLEEWSNLHYEKAFTDYLKANYEPIDILFRLAEKSSIVLLNGGGFQGPKWSIRVSLANLDDEAYSQIGQALHEALEDYVEEWQLSKK